MGIVHFRGFIQSLLPLLILALLLGCNEEREVEKLAKASKSQQQATNASRLFTLLSPSETKVDFQNLLQEQEEFNYFLYDYIYNGSGVAVGDLNNDGLPDLFFAGTMSSNRLYFNKGKLQFEDRSKGAGIQARALGTGVNIIDINGDGWNDIYVCHSISADPELRKNELYLNLKNGQFKEQATELGIADKGYSIQSYFFDFDQDEDLDLLVLNHRIDFTLANNIKIEIDSQTGKSKITKSEQESGKNRLYINNGKGQFKEQIQHPFEHSGFSLSACLADLDNDQLNDVFIANDYIDPDLLFSQGKNWQEQMQDRFDVSSRNSMGSDWADIDNDGDIDLITVDMISDKNYYQKTLKGIDSYDKFHSGVSYGLHYQVMRNALHLNNNGKFSDIATLAGVSHTDWSWSPLFLDADLDGWTDLFICNGNIKDATNLDFARYDLPKAMNSKTAINKLDLVQTLPSHVAKNRAFRNTGNLQFESKENTWGFDKAIISNGLAWADLDLDGDLDLVTNNLNTPASIFKNNAVEENRGNYLTVVLENKDSKNPKGLGAKVEIFIQGNSQQRQVYGTRGFLSCSEHIAHFGIGENNLIDSMRIHWSKNEIQTIRKVQVNRRIKVKKENTKSLPNKKGKIKNALVKNTGIKFIHKENEFIDFKREVLLPHKFSNRGPFISIADINKDGKEDFYIGGARGQAGALFIQHENGMKIKTNKIFQQYLDSEDQGSVFADFNQDGHLDLFIVSGGSSFEKNNEAYKDRLYWGDGTGNYEDASHLLPNEKHSGSTCISADWDKDGDLDIIVGGRVIPGEYPLPAQTLYLENTPDGFLNKSTLLPKNGKIGLVNDLDIFNNDKDIIVAGEWMNIKIISFNNGKFVEKTPSSLAKLSGSWNTIHVTDINKDGRNDIVAGNRGLNSFYSCSVDHPAEIIAGDFDGNNNIDFIISHPFENGISYPKATRDELFLELPQIRKKFARYKDYANAKINDILSPNQIKNAKASLKCNKYESGVFIQNTDGSFDFSALPIKAQTSPIFAIESLDFNKDDKLDLVVAGNNKGVDAETGIYSALKGLVLLGKGDGTFEEMNAEDSGIFLEGDCRDLQSIKINDRKILVAAMNDAEAKCFELSIDQR